MTEVSITSELKIVRINMADHLYRDERELRNRELLRPFGLEDYSREEDDAQAWHFVAHVEGCVVGCVLLVPNSKDAVYGQLRQMVVSEKVRGTGVGRALVKELLTFARQYDFAQVFLHARENAVGFYKRCGFEPVGDIFEEIGIPHQHMRLIL